DYWSAVGTPIPIATVSGALPPSSLSYFGATTTLKLLVTDSATGQSGTLRAGAGVSGWNDTDSGKGYLYGTAYAWGDEVSLGGHNYALGEYYQQDISDGSTATLYAYLYVDRPPYGWVPPVDPPPDSGSGEGDSAGLPPTDAGPPAAA